MRRFCIRSETILSLNIYLQSDISLNFLYCYVTCDGYGLFEINALWRYKEYNMISATCKIKHFFYMLTHALSESVLHKFSLEIGLFAKKNIIHKYRV